jgi:PDZ domain
MSVVPFVLPRRETRWRAWTRSVAALAVVVVLVSLGVANIAMRLRWHEVEDGVLWVRRSEGVTASQVAAGSAGDRAGIRAGDVLVAVNGSKHPKRSSSFITAGTRERSSCTRSSASRRGRRSRWL